MTHFESYQFIAEVVFKGHSFVKTWTLLLKIHLLILLKDDLWFALLYFLQVMQMMLEMAQESKYAQKRQAHTHSLSTIFWPFDFDFLLCMLNFLDKYSSIIAETAFSNKLCNFFVLFFFILINFRMVDEWNEKIIL